MTFIYVFSIMDYFKVILTMSFKVRNEGFVELQACGFLFIALTNCGLLLKYRLVTLHSATYNVGDMNDLHHILLR
jgi:hypothetical protein